MELLNDEYFERIKKVTSTSFQALFKDPNHVTISNIDYPQFEAITYRRQEK